MHLLIQADLEGKGKDAGKGMHYKAQVFKTKTKYEISLDKKDLKEINLVEEVSADMTAVGMGGKPISLFRVTIEGAPAIGRLVIRSTPAFAGIDAAISSEMKYESEAGVFEIEAENATGMDLPYLAEITARIARRACRKLSWTHHPLTLFDLKQSIGLVYDLQVGAEGAQDLEDWFGVRELIHLEDVKAAKAEIAAEKKAAKAKEKPPPKAKPKGAATKAPPKGKAKNAGKGKSASLSDLS